MFSIPHMVVLFVIVLVVFGPQKLPELARSLGKLMAETRHGVPQQRHGASDMRGRHRCAAKTYVSVVGGIIAGTSPRTRRADIGLDPVASVGSYRAATAKGGDGIGARS